MITNNIAEAVLIRTETSGIAAIEFTATVPSRSSGITFGRIQIDIATNQYGQDQFGSILDAGGLGANDIAQALGYVGVRRRDYSQQQIEDLPGALIKITDALANPAAQAQLEVAIQKQLSAVVRGVNQILAKSEELYQNNTDSVLHPDNPNYDYAVAYLIAAKNVNGYIPGILDLLADGPITSIEDLIAAYPNVNFGQIDEIARLGLSAIVNDQCFLAGTPVTMADGSTRPIEHIRPDDWVMSFDEKTGEMKPGRVKRVMRNTAKIVLDFHGIFVTPGHVYWCAGGRFEGRFAPLIDILRDDGVIQHQDGTLIRAATGCAVGSPDDQQFWALLTREEADADRVIDKRQLRFGTRWMLPDGRHFSMREYMAGIGAVPQPDGSMFFAREGVTAPFVWVLSDCLPNPEDFVLARSRVTLADIYRAGEWEGAAPAMPAPLVRDGGPVQPLPPVQRAAMPRNLPVAMATGAEPSVLLPDRHANRRSRKAEESRQRQAAKRKARLH